MRKSGVDRGSLDGSSATSFSRVRDFDYFLAASAAKVAKKKP